ncbi:hypothetical protein KZ483_05220 [Paenibacillus sp. sptzw28]|uniref:hypothetical protein n=1 Tax=Paenibacillus sp. sptzw28 TaxID=715179 RepID=UPI001C6E5A60|nr:hypothetical protein [Paenibacillus sp. sptzw28]QYR22385.1 hypothetical protein KZ483_05220 [Paenibacillus sp. sptzw28]
MLYILIKKSRLGIHPSLLFLFALELHRRNRLPVNEFAVDQRLLKRLIGILDLVQQHLHGA